MLFHRVDGGHDVVRLVADDLHLPAPGQFLPDLGDPLLEGVDDFDGVGAGLFADVHDDGRLAVDGGHRLGVGDAVLDARHVADFTG